MKKLVSVLAVLTCVFGLTACGGTEVNTVSGTAITDISTQESLIESGESLVEMIVYYADYGYTAEEFEEEYLAYYGQSMYEYYGLDSYADALDEYLNNADDIGTFTGQYDNLQAVIDDDGYYVVNVGIEGTEHSADIVITMDSSGLIEGFTVNVRYSFGELIGQAGLNTLLGMGTTFVVLILLMLVIYCFKFIGIFQAKQNQKAAMKREAEETPAAPEVSAPPEEEAEVDDAELIAVIAAAVAAYEGENAAKGTDGYVVRSIRKSRRKV